MDLMTKIVKVSLSLIVIESVTALTYLSGCKRIFGSTNAVGDPLD